MTPWAWEEERASAGADPTERKRACRAGATPAGTPSRASADNAATPTSLVLAKWLHSLKDRRPLAELRGSAGEPAWDILLDLYSREQAGRRTSVTAACIGARVPPTTALRHVNALCEAGHIERHRDRSDGRRCWLRLSPAMARTLDGYLDALAADMRALVDRGEHSSG